MNSKKMFSWSKRQSGSEQYYRTGGIVAIDTSPVVSNNGIEAKVTTKSGKRRPSELRIVTIDNKQIPLSPRSATYSATLANAASTLQLALNDMLRSPAPSAVACPLSASILKPLPGRPRSASLPSSPDLPAELPGSILQENLGFSSCVAAQDIIPVRPISQNIRRSTHPYDTNLDDREAFSILLNSFPEPLAHNRSVPDLSHPHGEMGSARSGNTLNSGALPRSSPSKVLPKNSLNETSSRRRSKSNLVTSPSSTDSKLTTCSTSTVGDSSNNSARARVGANKMLQPSPLILEGQTWTSKNEHRPSRRSELGTETAPTPTTTRSKQIEELKATIATQDQTISTLQTQFSSLRTSHESHVASLTDTHSAEVASLKNYARVLEEQLAQRPSLHHASSNNLLFLLDTTEPQTPSRETSQKVESNSFFPVKPSQSPVEKPRSQSRSSNSPEMENLKRKLSSARRPETTSRSLLPELNQYKQNNVALQKQIELLMAKLNESKKSERAAKSKCDEWQEKAEAAEKVEKSAQALQNTIDHLENRLEIANIERLDAEEHLFNVQAQKSPFDFSLSKLQAASSTNHEESNAAKNARLSMSTIFSSSSPTSPEIESQELSTLAAFIAHIERLQDQVRQKDSKISELESSKEELRQRHDQLKQEQISMSLQMDIQNDLLRKSRRTDTHIEQLRTAIIDRETIISDREKSIRALERQLEYHKLLLQAEIRRYATKMLHVPIDEDPLPDLGTLAARADIDRWIERLHTRMRNEKSKIEDKIPADANEAQVINLRQEIDFYVREIILYKLDIRGYKSDVKKLKRITAQLGSYGRASDLDSDTSSLRPVATPSRALFAATTPELGSSNISSPVLPGAVSESNPVGRHNTPPPSGPLSTGPPSKRVPLRLDLRIPLTPPTPTSEIDRHMTNGADQTDAGISPRSVVRLSPERRKPTPPSPNQMKFGDLLTNFPLNTPAAPQKHERSMSESVLPVYRTAHLPEWPLRLDTEGTVANYRTRSASVSESSKGRVTPERPPRPRIGLFESPQSKRTAVFVPSSPPRTDIMAEAIKYSPEQQAFIQSRTRSRNNSNASSVTGAPARMLRDVRDSIASSPSPIPPAVFRSRAGSAGSATANTPIPLSSPPERKLSAASSSSIPFVIAMGSPHNPATQPTTISMTPTPCAITRNAPLKINPPTSRTGVGGTMASFTPVTTPISPTDMSRFDPPPRPMSTKLPAAAPAAPSRKFSLSRKQDEQSSGVPRTPSRSRSVSANSIRTAIRLPKTRDKDKDGQRIRKGSISMPQPQGGVFGGDGAVVGTVPNVQNVPSTTTTLPFKMGLSPVIVPEALRVPSYQNFVRIDVGIGNELTTYKVPAEILFRRSEFFKRAIHGKWKEAVNKIVKFPEDNPEIFEFYIHLLYTGQLPRIPDGIYTDGNIYEEVSAILCHLYVFAEKVHDVKAKNAIIRAIRAMSSDKDGAPDTPGEECVEIIYKEQLLGL
ncbi:hypothetical protein GQ44DRAFT_770569 [Phaeosphaeriaceae sp. PMI808]|nr:hypothetical protein GQ44DRAFT_770569 [Phaeosphaeriaceae sp. PMI808]